MRRLEITFVLVLAAGLAASCGKSEAEKLRREARQGSAVAVGKYRSQVHMMTDQKQLAEIAGSEDPGAVRLAAAGKLRDVELARRVIREIATTDRDGRTRLDAVLQLPDPDRAGLLTEMALGDWEQGIRLGALQAISDPQLIIEVYRRSVDPRLRIAAIRHPGLNDPGLLAEIAVNDPDAKLRQAAVGNIHFRDGETLARVLRSDRQVSVRRAAVNKVSDQALLAELAVHDADWMVRETAVAKLDDAGLLERIAAADPHGAVRRAAERRLRGR